MFPLLLIGAASAGGVLINLDGHTSAALDVSAPKQAAAGFKINSDGTLDTWHHISGFAQVDVATDWIIPNGAASAAAYEIRYTSFTGDSLTTDDFGGVNNWVALSGSPDVRLATTEDVTEALTCSFTLEIRIGAVTLATGSYTITAENSS